MLVVQRSNIIVQQNLLSSRGRSCLIFFFFFLEAFCRYSVHYFAAVMLFGIQEVMDSGSIGQAAVVINVLRRIFCFAKCLAASSLHNQGQKIVHLHCVWTVRVSPIYLTFSAFCCLPKTYYCRMVGVSFICTISYTALVPRKVALITELWCS